MAAISWTSKTSLCRLAAVSALPSLCPHKPGIAQPRTNQILKLIELTGKCSWHQKNWMNHTIHILQFEKDIESLECTWFCFSLSVLTKESATCSRNGYNRQAKTIFFTARPEPCAPACLTTASLSINVCLQSEWSSSQQQNRHRHKTCRQFHGSAWRAWCFSSLGQASWESSEIPISNRKVKFDTTVQEKRARGLIMNSATTNGWDHIGESIPENAQRSLHS